MVVGKDSRTYPATLEQGKTHALAVAALRRQPRPLPLSCARTDYADKYAVSIRSILTLPITATYFSSLTSFSFLGDVSSMYPVAFQPFLYLYLPPTDKNTRQLNYRTQSVLHTALYNNSTYDETTRN